MRRGLISWSRDEVPQAALEARVARLQEAMRAQGLDAVLAYCSFDRPAAVSWLTHFVPYYNEALLAVFAGGAPVLFAAFSKRVHPWIREVSHVGEVIGAPSPGRAAAALIKERLLQAKNGAPRIGVIERDTLPWSVAEPMIQAGLGGALADATALFAAVRQPADAAEVLLAGRSVDIARKAFDGVPRGVRRASELFSALEGAARLAGAEEVIMRLAPDLAAGAALRRIEGDAPLGANCAVQLSLAYKATWIRLVRCLAMHEPPPSWKQSAHWLRESASRLHEANILSGPDAAQAPGTLATWTVEACLGSHPLSVIARGGAPAPSPLANGAPTARLPAGALEVLSVQLETKDGPWHGAVPIVLGENGKPSRLLAPD